MRHHGQRHHMGDDGGRFGKREHHFKRHGGPREEGMHMRRGPGGKHHGGFERYIEFAMRCLSESELFNNPTQNANNTPEKVQQVVQAFFDKWGRGKGWYASNKPEQGAEGTTDTDGGNVTPTRGEWRRHHRGRRGFGRAGWTYGPCTQDQAGRTNEGEVNTTEGKETEEGTTQKPQYGWHFNPDLAKKAEEEFRRSCAACGQEKGRSAQEEPSNTDGEDKVKENQPLSEEEWIIVRRALDYGRLHRGPGGHHGYGGHGHGHHGFHGPHGRHGNGRRHGWGKHNHFKGGKGHRFFPFFMDELRDQEVSSSDVPAAIEPMESTAEENQEKGQEKEQEKKNPEVEEVADTLRKSSLNEWEHV